MSSNDHHITGERKRKRKQELDPRNGEPVIKVRNTSRINFRENLKQGVLMQLLDGDAHDSSPCTSLQTSNTRKEGNYRKERHPIVSRTSSCKSGKNEVELSRSVINRKTRSAPHQSSEKEIQHVPILSSQITQHGCQAKPRREMTSAEKQQYELYMQWHYRSMMLHQQYMKQTKAAHSNGGNPNNYRPPINHQARCSEMQWPPAMIRARAEVSWATAIPKAFGLNNLNSSRHSQEKTNSSRYQTRPEGELHDRTSLKDMHRPQSKNHHHHSKPIQQQHAGQPSNPQRYLCSSPFSWLQQPNKPEQSKPPSCPPLSRKLSPLERLSLQSIELSMAQSRSNNTTPAGGKSRTNPGQVKSIGNFSRRKDNLWPNEERHRLRQYISPAVTDELLSVAAYNFRV